MDEDRQGWKAFRFAELFQAKAPSSGRGTPEIFSISPSSPNPNKAGPEYNLRVLADQDGGKRRPGCPSFLKAPEMLRTLPFSTLGPGGLVKGVLEGVRSPGNNSPASGCPWLCELGRA